MCVFAVGCQKKETMVDSGDASELNQIVTENVVSYKDLMDKWDRKTISEINFVDSNMQKFNKEYDQKAYVSFNDKDTVTAYLVNTNERNTIYFVSNGPIKLLSGKALFDDFENCEKINGLEMLDTSDVTDMGYMFNDCKSLMSLNVTNFDTNKVTYMGSMFKGCKSLASLDVTNFDTGKVTSMIFMFYDCSGLTSLDVTSFDTSKVTNMENMFSYCRNLTSLDVTNFDTSEVTDMSSMFSSCESLTNLDVSGFDISKVTDTDYMFYGCDNLKNVDLSRFNK